MLQFQVRSLCKNPSSWVYDEPRATFLDWYLSLTVNQGSGATDFNSPRKAGKSNVSKVRKRQFKYVPAVYNVQLGWGINIQRLINAHYR